MSFSSNSSSGQLMSSTVPLQRTFAEQQQQQQQQLPEGT
jgi:hypothetical protein